MDKGNRIGARCGAHASIGWTLHHGTERAVRGVASCLLVLCALFLMSTGCRQDELAGTNVLSIPNGGPWVPSSASDNTITIDTDSVQGIASVMRDLDPGLTLRVNDCSCLGEGTPERTSCEASSKTSMCIKPSWSNSYWVTLIPDLVGGMNLSINSATLNGLPAFQNGISVTDIDVTDLEPLNPGGTKARYDIDVGLDPAGAIEVAAHYAASATDGTKPADRDPWVGLWFPVVAKPVVRSLDGGTSPFQGTATCECKNGVPKPSSDPSHPLLPQCNEVCGTVIPLDSPGVHWGDLSLGECTVDIAYRINAIRFKVGLIPGSPSANGSDVDWPGELHLIPAGAPSYPDRLPKISVVIAGLAAPVEGHDRDHFDRVWSSDADIALGIHVSCPYYLGPVSFDSLCGTLNATGNCENRAINDTVGPMVTGQIQTTIANQLKGTVEDFLMFSPEKTESYPPSACDIVQRPADCIDPIASTFLPASATFQVIQWFDGIFGPYDKESSRCRKKYQNSIAPPVFPWYASPPVVVPAPTSRPKDGAAASIQYTVLNVDSDHDGITDDQDLCPDWVDSNPAHNVDSDCDGIGDACDLYPGDINNDQDRDGIPEPFDNCPLIPNPDQANSNREAEDSFGASELGDACDPVPSIPTGPVIADVALDNCKLEGVAWSTLACQYQAMHDEFLLMPTGSHSIDRANKPEVTIPDVPTHFRFCQKSLDDGIMCNERDNNELSKMTKDDHWHKITLSSQQMPFQDGDLVDYPTYSPIGGVVYKYKKLRWNYTNDHDLWHAQEIKGVSPWQDLPGGRRASGLDGVLWSHGDTLVGSDEAHPVPTEQGDGATTYGWHKSNDNQSLVNYWHDYYAPDAAVWRRWSVKKTLWPNTPALDIGCAACRRLGPWSPAFDPVRYYIMPMGNGEFAALTDEERWPVITNQVSPTLQQEMVNGGLTWVTAAEPYPNVGMPVALALDSGGTGLVDELMVADTVIDGEPAVLLQSARDRQTAMAFLDGGTAGLGPQPRRDFGVVYSSSLWRIFLIGGIDRSTGEPAGDIWVAGGATGSWSRLPTPGYEPGQVLASTYSFSDRKLYVADVEKKLGLNFERVARIDVQSGRVEVLGEWPYLGVYETQQLVVDQDGSVLFAVSSASLKAHSVYRIRNDDPDKLRVELVNTGPDVLALPPLVDGSGYTFVTAHSAGDAEVAVSRVPVLRRMHFIDVLQAWF